MHFLRFDLYNQGNVGFFNNLMSLELAAGLSVLSNRRLLLNTPEYPIFNSDKQMKILDLVDLFLPHQTGDFSGLDSELLPDLRFLRIGVPELVEFDDAEVLATCNDQTLGYYSYVLAPDERVTYACNRLIAVKEPYRRAALTIARELRQANGRFASVHIRRTDFIHDHEQSRATTADEILHNITIHVPLDDLLVIHSDEADQNYFQEILDTYPNHCLLDKVLFRAFYPETLDATELGLVSALVACHSDIFLGTMFSTFTGYIQRQRLLNGAKEEFLYIYNQRPEGLSFKDGRILENGMSGPTWDRIDMSDELKSICFWWREWPECAGPLATSESVGVANITANRNRLAGCYE
jgi:hypothetical protein